MKTTLLAPRNLTREVPVDDAARLLASGSWVRVGTTKLPDRKTGHQQAYRKRRRDAGAKPVYLWLPPETKAALLGLRHPGESVTEVVCRLVADKAQ